MDLVEEALAAARECNYLPPVVTHVKSNPPRPARDDDSYVWERYLLAAYRMKDVDLKRLSDGVRGLKKASFLVGGPALHHAYKALNDIVTKVHTYSHVSHMVFAMNVNHIVNASDMRVDAIAYENTLPNHSMTVHIHKAYTLTQTARYLMSRASYRHETKDDGMAVIRASGYDGKISYGHGLIVLNCLGSQSVLSTAEWSQAIRSFTSRVVWEHVKLMYSRIHRDMSRMIDQALDRVEAAWDTLGSIAPYVLHKAHSRAIAMLNVESGCAEGQDEENRVKWTAKYPDKAADMLAVYAGYTSMIENHIDTLGVGAGLIPAAAYRLLPEEHGDHLQALDNYVTKVVDFADIEDQYPATMEATLRELDALALSAAAQRRDVDPPRQYSQAEWAALNPDAPQMTKRDFDAASIKALNRLMNLKPGQVLSVTDASFLDPTGCMVPSDWTTSFKTKAKDRAMMPDSKGTYLDYRQPISFKSKNKLAYVHTADLSPTEVARVRVEHMQNPIVATDVKPEMHKPGDAKRVFYETQIGAWMVLGETDEAIGANLAPINGYVLGKSTAEQAELFHKFIANDGTTPWFFCTDIEGFSRNISTDLNVAKANRYAMYMQHPSAAMLGAFFDEAAVYGRDKFGAYGPVYYKSDLEGLTGKANTGWHLAIVKSGIGDLKAYLDGELRVWAAPARFMCLIDDGILRVALKRPLTVDESRRAFDIMCAAYRARRHQIDRTKAYYGHSTALFLDRLAVNGELVRNWTKVLGKVSQDVEVPLASWDMKVAGIYATAAGMADAGAPAWIAAAIAAAVALHSLEAFTGRPVVPSDGFCLAMPIDYGGYGGVRMSMLTGINLTDGLAGADSILRKLSSSEPTRRNRALCVARVCATLILQAEVLDRTNVGVLRNPAGISLNLGKLDVNAVNRAVQRVLAKVISEYDENDHIDTIEAINGMDLSGIENVAALRGLANVTKLVRYDNMVSKVRRARFVIRLIGSATRNRIAQKHKQDIGRVQKWFCDRAPFTPVNLSQEKGVVPDEVYQVH